LLVVFSPMDNHIEPMVLENREMAEWRLEVSMLFSSSGKVVPLQSSVFWPFMAESNNFAIRLK